MQHNHDGGYVRLRQKTVVKHPIAKTRLAVAAQLDYDATTRGSVKREASDCLPGLGTGHGMFAGVEESLQETGLKLDAETNIVFAISTPLKILLQVFGIGTFPPSLVQGRQVSEVNLI